MKNSVFFCMLLLGICSLGFAQNAFTPKFTACVLRAPTKTYPGKSKIAVLDFKSNADNEAGLGDGAKIADYITKALLLEKRGYNADKTHFEGGTTKIFDVMDRSSIREALEKNQQIGGDIDENVAVQIGKLLGVDLVIVGNCSYTWQDETSKTSYKDKQGKIHYTFYRSRTVNAEARMSIIEVETGEYVGSTNSTTEKKASSSSRTGYPGPGDVESPESLGAKAYSSISYGLIGYLAPRYSVETFYLQNIKNKDFKQRAKDAKQQLQLNNLTPAFKVYNAIYDNDNYNPKAAYNLGAIYEAAGDYAKAKEMYEIAYQLDTEEKLYDSGLSRAKTGLELVEIFAELGVEIIPKTFKAGDAEKLLREKVVIKGKKSDRIEVYSAPDLESEIVQKVPGGMEFFVNEKTEDFVLVDLKIGNEEGYILRKQVREGK